MQRFLTLLVPGTQGKDCGVQWKEKGKILGPAAPRNALQMPGQSS